VNWRRVLLSVALVAGCIWCLGLVRQVHSEEKAGLRPQKPACKAVSVTPLNTFGHRARLPVGRGRDADSPVEPTGRAS